jgi:hypothetical protein
MADVFMKALPDVEEYSNPRMQPLDRVFEK